jgi:hypothetical protein
VKFDGYNFEVEDDGGCVAAGYGQSLVDVKREAAHYAAQYAEDGPVKVRLFARFEITEENE